MYREIFAYKNIFGTVPKKCVKTYDKITEIKCMLEKLYGYTPEEAKDYTELILEGICDEAVQTYLPNRAYINNALDKRIKSLETGSDIGANITKLSNRVENLINVLEECSEKADTALNKISRIEGGENIGKYSC